MRYSSASRPPRLCPERRAASGGRFDRGARPASSLSDTRRRARRCCRRSLGPRRRPRFRGRKPRNRSGRTNADNRARAWCTLSESRRYDPSSPFCRRRAIPDGCIPRFDTRSPPRCFTNIVKISRTSGPKDSSLSSFVLRIYLPANTEFVVVILTNPLFFGDENIRAVGRCSAEQGEALDCISRIAADRQGNQKQATMIDRSIN